MREQGKLTSSSDGLNDLYLAAAAVTLDVAVPTFAFEYSAFKTIQAVVGPFFGIVRAVAFNAFTSSRFFFAIAAAFCLSLKTFFTGFLTTFFAATFFFTGFFTAFLGVTFFGFAFVDFVDFVVFGFVAALAVVAYERWMENENRGRDEVISAL